MRDKQNARSVVKMAVIMNVDQEMIGQTLFLDPAVEDWNEIVNLDGSGIVDEKLDPQSMNVHYGFPAAFCVSPTGTVSTPAPPRSVKESWQAYVASMKSCASSTIRCA